MVMILGMLENHGNDHVDARSARKMVPIMEMMLEMVTIIVILLERDGSDAAREMASPTCFRPSSCLLLPLLPERKQWEL